MEHDRFIFQPGKKKGIRAHAPAFTLDEIENFRRDEPEKISDAIPKDRGTAIAEAREQLKKESGGRAAKSK